MISSAALIAFVATSAPDESRHFYEETIGLRFVADESFALVFDANGTMLRISKVQDFSPAPFTALRWVVPDIWSEVSALVESGVSFELCDGLDQDDDGICTGRINR